MGPQPVRSCPWCPKDTFLSFNPLPASQCVTLGPSGGVTLTSRSQHWGPPGLLILHQTTKIRELSCSIPLRAFPTQPWTPYGATARTPILTSLHPTFLWAFRSSDLMLPCPVASQLTLMETNPFS